MSRFAWHYIVTEAWQRRQAWPALRDTTALRVVDGAVDAGPAGVAIDRYGDDFVVWMREGTDDAMLPAIAEALASSTPGAAVVAKRLARRTEDSRSKRVAGKVAPEHTILDDGVKLVARLEAGLQTGVFLDLRSGRRWVRKQARGAEVLNLFAYTGSLTAHALVGGAARVTTVDASRAALTWARNNAALNGIDPDQHRWFADDAFSVLRRAKVGAYDAVILDPPAYGRAGSKRFVLRRDLSSLLQQAFRVVRPGGWVFVSTHDPEIDLERAVGVGLTQAGRGGAVVWRFAPDPDFPGLGAVRRDEVSVALAAVAVRVDEGRRE